jgi:hypothetical protein
MNIKIQLKPEIASKITYGDITITVLNYNNQLRTHSLKNALILIKSMNIGARIRIENDNIIVRPAVSPASNMLGPISAIVQIIKTGKRERFVREIADMLISKFGI